MGMRFRGRGKLQRLVPFALLAIGVLASPCALAAQEVTRVSLGDGIQGAGTSSNPVLSANGRVVAFTSSAANLALGDTNNVGDVFVRDVKTGLTTKLSAGFDGSVANSFSVNPAISANGRFVVFLSAASNLVPGDTNGAADIFVHDRSTGLTTRVSVRSDGSEANAQSFDPAISANGEVVAFASLASNLVDDDTNLEGDVFVHDLKTGVTKLASVGSDGG